MRVEPEMKNGPLSRFEKAFDEAPRKCGLWALVLILAFRERRAVWDQFSDRNERAKSHSYVGVTWPAKSQVDFKMGVRGKAKARFSEI